MKGENEYIIISKNLFSFSLNESGREERGNKKEGQNSDQSSSDKHPSYPGGGL